MASSTTSPLTPWATTPIGASPSLTSVSQTLGWALSRSWSELLELTEGVSCQPDIAGFGSRAAIDDLVMVTHCLGSRVTIDAHSGYGVDEPVAALLADSAGHAGVAPIVAERCSFRETDEGPMR